MLSLRNVRLTLKMLRGAVVGGLKALLAAVILLAIVGTVFGYGPLLPLYYLGLLVVYIFPAGMLIGGVIAAVRAATRRQPTDESIRLHPAVFLLWVGIPLVLLAIVVIVPASMVGVERVVTHGAAWTTNAQMHPECPVPVVILMLVNYAEYNVVCSSELLNHLEQQSNAIVPIQYLVTYDFNEPRGYNLANVDGIDITWSEWLGSRSGCGGQYTPPCDSPQLRNESSLYASSWTGDEN